MNADLPRPPTPPLPAPAGAFEDVRRRARRRRGARMAALSLATVLPLAVAGVVAAGVLDGSRDPRDSVGPAQTAQECPGPYPSASGSPSFAPGGQEPASSAPGSGVMPPPRPTIPPGTPDATGTLRAADGSYVRCGGIYLVDGETFRLVARSDRHGRWSTPCRHGRMAAFAFEPHQPYRELVDGDHAFVRFENPAGQTQPCSQPVDVRMGAPSTVTIRLTGVPSPGPGDPARELRLTCGDLDAFSGEPLVVLRPDPADGLYRAGGLAPCMYSFAYGDEDVVELRVLEAGENAQWEVRAR